MDKEKKADDGPDLNHRACGRDRSPGHYIHGNEMIGRHLAFGEQIMK